MYFFWAGWPSRRQKSSKLKDFLKWGTPGLPDFRRCRYSCMYSRLRSGCPTAPASSGSLFQRPEYSDQSEEDDGQDEMSVPGPVFHRVLPFLFLVLLSLAGTGRGLGALGLTMLAVKENSKY